MCREQGTCRSETELAIPILRIQMNQSINADMRRSMSSKTGHGHQTYTMDPCQYDSNLIIVTKNTLWIYVLKNQI